MYAYIKDGQIAATFDTVPHSFENVSGFDMFSEGERIAFGVVTVVDRRPALPTEFHYYVNDQVVVVAGVGAARDASVAIKPADQIRATLTTRINATCEQKINVGFTYFDRVYDSDRDSLSAITDTQVARSAGFVIASDFTWRTKANVDVSMSGAEFDGLVVAAILFVHGIRANSWDIKQALAAATNPETFDISQGW